MKSVRKIFVVCIMFIFAANMIFPKTATAITLKEEEEMAKEFLKVLRQHFQVIRDPLIADYVNSIGQKVLSAFPPQPFPYHFYIIKENTYNAFAAPAGHIFINSGLFEAMESEEELAGILSHEISHVVCRHISQKIERSSKIGLMTLAGIAAGIFLGVGGAGAAAANALGVGSMAAGQSLSLAYGREDERQADHVGLKYLTKAGYSGTGLLKILEKIKEKEWYGPDVIPTYLSTHPAIDERIIHIRNQAGSNPGSQTPAPEFQRAHTRLFAVYGNENAAIKKFEEQIRKHPDDPIVNYGYALIMGRTGNRKTAVSHFKKALEKRAFDPHILKDMGITYFLDGQYPKALKTLEGSVSMEANNPDGLFFLGRTHMALENFNEAVSAFETLLEKHPDYKSASYFIGKAYGKSGKMALAHYHLGIYYKERKDLKNARFHLQKALKLTHDPYKKAEIEEMLKYVGKEAVKKERERRKAEE